MESSFAGSATAPVEGAAPPDTSPDAATNPSPADGALNVALNASLSWTAGARADSHDVYFGTSSPPPFAGNQPGTSFDPPGDLAINTLYYWRIDEVNDFGTTTGTPWSFTTGATTAAEVVTITKAEWNNRRKELKVEATSSDQPNVELTVVGFGQMNFKNGKYALKVKPVDNPVTVTVTSTGGGSATETVRVR